jgi:hypothetical protein
MKNWLPCVAVHPAPARSSAPSPTPVDPMTEHRPHASPPRTSRRTSRTAGLWAAAIAVGLSGCDGPAHTVLIPNQPPTVRITRAPRSVRDTAYYAVNLNWIGYDPDGRVGYYDYAVDPPTGPGSDTTWSRTVLSEQTILFRTSISNPATNTAEQPHVFAIRAVDNRLARSPVVTRAFWSRTEAPTVQITGPRPSEGSRAYVTPAVRIRWTGDDPDGVFTRKPLKYKYILLDDNTPVTQRTARTSTAGPDTIRRYYAPRNFAGWDSVSGDTTQVQFRNLIPDNEYVLSVIAIDEAGAYSPIFSFNTNCLYFRVSFAGPRNPIIRIYNSFFDYRYAQGSYEPLNPDRWIVVEFPAGVSIPICWDATATPGSEMRGYRWAVDILDLTDETPRSRPDDYAHWSTWDLGTTCTTLHPYAGSDTVHTFYLEAEDINGLRSLGIVKFTVIAATPTKPLLVVKDYRLLQVDQRSPGQALCVDPPKGVWPTVAELDSFLFARGGAPWRCYPDGAISTRGLFAGYPFDTVGTRTGGADLAVKLSTLAKYEKVVWIVDRNGASFVGSGISNNPMSSLRYMSSRNRANTLAIYLGLGGKAWLLGGGGGAAATIDYNDDRGSNDTQPPAPSETYAFGNELVPGRFMYDLAKWQSQFKATTGVNLRFDRHFGRNAGLEPYASSGLPERLGIHNRAEDPFPPNRDPRNQPDFYYTRIQLEYLSRPNPYQEDFDPGPGEAFASALDTVLSVEGAGIVQPQDNRRNVVMTVYPAWERDPSAKLVFSGIDIWSWRRSHSQALVDFVLRGLWGLNPSPTAAEVRATAPVATGTVPAEVRAARTPQSLQRARGSAVNRKGP